jgi:hypothetical protein
MLDARHHVIEEGVEDMRANESILTISVPRSPTVAVAPRLAPES